MRGGLQRFFAGRTVHALFDRDLVRSREDALARSKRCGQARSRARRKRPSPAARTVELFVAACISGKASEPLDMMCTSLPLVDDEPSRLHVVEEGVDEHR